MTERKRKRERRKRNKARRWARQNRLVNRLHETSVSGVKAFLARVTRGE